MRRRALGVFITLLVCVGACSRHQVASEAQSATPSVGTTSIMLATAVDEPAADAGSVTSTAASAPLASPLTGKTVLHVGDSMVGGQWGLTRALEQKFAAEGAKLVRDYKVSESIVSYDKSSKLKDLIAKHHPDIVILTLGTNDVFVPYPASMAGNVQNIVRRIGNRECYWMGPPTWKPDTGIVQVLRENVAPCKFFDSSSLKLQRASDGIHPTDRGGADWANSFWSFFRPTADAGAP